MEGFEGRRSKVRLCSTPRLPKPLLRSPLSASPSNPPFKPPSPSKPLPLNLGSLPPLRGHLPFGSPPFALQRSLPSQRVLYPTWAKPTRTLNFGAERWLEQWPQAQRNTSVGATAVAAEECSHHHSVAIWTRHSQMRAAARRSWRWLSRFFGGTYPAVPSLRAELEQVRAQAQVPPVQERINSSSSTKELASVPTQRQQNLFNAQNEIREGEERLERLRAEAHSADHCWFQPPSRGCRKNGAPPFSGCGLHRCASAEGHGRLLARCVAMGSDWTTSTISALVIVATQDQCDVDNTVLSDLSILPYEKKKT